VALAKKVEEGKFRHDLYYRLKVGQITIPPLRTRQEEIVPLALLFLREFAQNKRKHFSRISTPAANILKQYNWPGNVRELRNVIEWATFMYDDVELKSQHLGTIRDDSKPVVADRSNIDPKHILIELTSSGVSLEEVKNKLARRVLELHGGNKSAAARYLGVSRRALCTYLEEKFENNT
jgi:DNA-binding NtrC family response regulator